MYDSLVYIDVNKAAAELCRRKLSNFVKEFWGTIIAEELIWEPHMDVLCDEIQSVFERVFLQPDPADPEPDKKKKRKTRLAKINDVIINIPPGTTKSTILTIMAPAWAWSRDASLRIITGSYSDSLATEHSVKSRDIITSDKYRLYYPEVEIKDHKGLKTNYETTANGQRFATSVGGTVTGVHAHVVIIDDPLNPKQAASQVECRSANEWMDKTLSTRKVDKKVSVLFLMMQRVAVNDATGHLLSKQKENVRHICLPGELAENVSPVEYRDIYQDGLLSPRRMGRPELAELKKDLGAAGYAGQIAQRPAPEGGTVWQKWFIEVPDEMFPDFEQLQEPWTDWDLSYTKEDKNSASAYFKTGVLAGNVYIYDFDWRWLEFPELIKWMVEVGGPHAIEAKASGKSARQVLKQGGVIAVEVKVSGDKVARAKSATPIAESGKVYIKKSLVDRLYNDPKQGVLFFPNGEHNDVADALSQALVRRSKNGKIIVGQNSAARPTNKPNPLDYIE